MHGEESSAALSPKMMISRFAILLLVSIGVGVAGGATVLEAHPDINYFGLCMNGSNGNSIWFRNGDQVLHVEPEQHDVAVLHDVLLALGAD